MVFCSDRAFFRCRGKFIIILKWFVRLFSGQSAGGGCGCMEEERKQKTRPSVSFVSFAKGNPDGSRTCEFPACEWDMKCTASFTVETAMVLGIVFFCFAVILKQAYVLHDTVTGTMILEEVLENVRVSRDADSAAVFTEQGEKTGNPRLWLGDYRLEIESNGEIISGKAHAGDWTQEMKMDMFHPGRFLRRFEAIKAVGKELRDGGNGVQEGNEPELYGNTPEAGAE